MSETLERRIEITPGHCWYLDPIKAKAEACDRRIVLIAEHARDG